jgi:ABC-type lipoprotein export system ATPase subunit
MDMLIQFENVTKQFRGPQGEVTALDGVSFALAPGEFVGVCGPSGCGKSTLLLLAGTLLRPSAGRVLLDGCDVGAARAAERRRLRASTVGFVFQQFHLLAYLTVLENILTPAGALPAKDARSRAEELVERFGLGPRRDHLPAQLSTGEKQRTALARALLNRPKILLADEPTGNLDPENGQVVLEALADFASAGGAVLLVTHDPDAVQRAQRVLRLAQGRVLP